MTQTAPLAFLAPEEAARANFYGLIARLFYRAPDTALIAELIAARPIDGEGELALAWQEMVAACAKAFPVALENEHTDLFIGTGKAEVTPYLSHYVLKHRNDNPLVELRQQMATWGIGRRDDVPEYEDHVSTVCETMRFIIAVQQRSSDEQRSFFEGFIYRGTMAFCSAVSASGKADFYRRVARLTQSFLDIEKIAFEMEV